MQIYLEKEIKPQKLLDVRFTINILMMDQFCQKTQSFGDPKIAGKWNLSTSEGFEFNSQKIVTVSGCHVPRKWSEYFHTIFYSV